MQLLLMLLLRLRTYVAEYDDVVGCLLDDVIEVLRFLLHKQSLE